MEKNFDFKQVGKRMPYSVPDGFFDHLEASVVSEIHSSNQPTMSRRRRTVKIVLRSLVAAAAAIAVFFIVNKTLSGNKPMSSDFSNVDLAYSNLSPEDQDFIIQAYEDDYFINDQFEIEEQ